jgi:Ca-activated chloride channel family protein
MCAMKSLVALITLLAIVLQTTAQTPAPPAAGQTRPQKVVINVNDNTGRYILNVKPTDLVVEEDGKPQTITSFIADSDIPVSLGILIDKSTSMRLPLRVEGKETIPAAILAAAGVARAVVKLMRPQDEFQLMTFDEKVQIKVPFTQDQKKIVDQLYKMNVVGDATNLYDSVLNAMDKMKKAKYRRKALIVITDAYDTSGKQLEDIRTQLSESEVQVFTCGLRSVFEEVPDPAAEPLFQLVLRTLSGDTGGLSLVIDVPELQATPSIEGIIGFAQIIALELRGQYTLTYNTDKTGSLASRFVRVRAPNYPNLRVRIRRDAEEPIKPQGK